VGPHLLQPCLRLQALSAPLLLQEAQFLSQLVPVIRRLLSDILELGLKVEFGGLDEFLSLLYASKSPR
jgi:hypothetical protein